MNEVATSHSRLIVSTTTLAAALWSVLFIQPAQAQGGRPLETPLTGAEESPGPGDPDGTGTALLRVNPGQEKICFELAVSDIAPAGAAHIHVGHAGVTGPVVVALEAPTSGVSVGCVSVDRDLALRIIRDPQGYYVNVHNAEFPGGAVRGQLGD